MLKDSKINNVSEHQKYLKIYVPQYSEKILKKSESLKKITDWVNTLIEPVLMIFIAVGVLEFL